jgi:hypothetical protein
MRYLVPLLFVAVLLMWLAQFLWFVFVDNFENVVAVIAITFLILLIFYIFQRLIFSKFFKES